MGTYTKLVLKNKNKASEINHTLVEKFGDVYFGEFEGVYFGAFYSEEMLSEDIRFCNEDEEGLKQNTHISRPFSRESFLRVGREVGTYFVKISCPSDEEMISIRALQKWLKTDKNLNYLDLKKSTNVDRILTINILV